MRFKNEEKEVVQNMIEFIKKESNVEIEIYRNSAGDDQLRTKGLNKNCSLTPSSYIEAVAWLNGVGQAMRNKEALLSLEGNKQSLEKMNKLKYKVGSKPKKSTDKQEEKGK